MSTSGFYSFAVTRDDIIRQAFLSIGKLDPFESPDAQQTQDTTIVLNMMVKQWMGKADFAPGLKVWTRRRGHVFLQNNSGRYLLGPASTTGWTNDYVYPVTTVAAAAAASSLTLSSVAGIATGYYIGVELDSGALFWTTVNGAPAGLVVTLASALPSAAASGAQVFVFQTIAQQPLLIEAAVLRDQTLVDTPVNIIQTTQTYDALSNKADPTFQQDPIAVYYENQLGYGYLYTDCGAAQDVTKHLVITYQEPVQDFLNPLDNPYFPQEWYWPLCLGLGKRICPQYNRPWSQLNETNYTEAMMIARNKDPERSEAYFQPYAEN
jgi:hypothetical protein